MKWLVVVAHPDDEVLGAGATIKKVVEKGDEVDVCIMCGEVNARAFRPEDNELNSDLESCVKFLGIKNVYKGSFENIKMNNANHLELVQFIEKAIISSSPDIIITHHMADTNNDHMHTSLACQAAIRLFQRNTTVKPIKELWFMETLSSTEWAVNTAMNKFQPNVFVEVQKQGIEDKIKGLSMYRGVMRDYPHSRSAETILGLAAYRGSQAGVNYAEAFECALRRII